MNYEIIPGILEKEQSILQKKFNTAAKFASTIQIDIIDTKFSEVTINPRLAFTKNYETALELHLMVQNPEDWIDSYQSLRIKRAIGHVEFMQSEAKFIANTKSNGIDPFLGIDLNTDIESYLGEELITKGLKGFLIMTVKAGRSGQNFHEEALKKAVQLRNKFGDSIDIEIDGGVNESIIKRAQAAGVNLFAATSAIFTDNPEKSYKNLVKRLEEK